MAEKVAIKGTPRDYQKVAEILGISEYAIYQKQHRIKNGTMKNSVGTKFTIRALRYLDDKTLTFLLDDDNFKGFSLKNTWQNKNNLL